MNHKRFKRFKFSPDRLLETAISRAETKYLEIYSDVKTGKKIFGITLGELIDAYIDWRSKDVDGGKITSGRLLTIQSQLRNLSRYKSNDTKISELDRSSLYDYAQWRRTDKSKTQDVTIRNEQVTFNHMMAYAYRNGLAYFDKFDFQLIKIKEIKKSRSRESAQDDKWSFSLIAAMIAATRRYHEQKTAPEPHTGFQGEGGVCGHQG